MSSLACIKTLVFVTLIALVLAVAGSSQAQGTTGPNGRPPVSQGHHEGDGHHSGNGGGRHDANRSWHQRPYIYYRYVYPHYYPYYAAPSYWYYCPSYGTYYPYTESCPEAWVPVPAW